MVTSDIDDEYVVAVVVGEEVAAMYVGHTGRPSHSFVQVCVRHCAQHALARVHFHHRMTLSTSE